VPRKESSASTALEKQKTKSRLHSLAQIEIGLVLKFSSVSISGLDIIIANNLLEFSRNGLIIIL